MAEYKLTILGTVCVGKSALTSQLITGHFLDEYDPTIEDSFRKQVTIDEQVCILDVLDTAGRDEYTPLRDQYLRAGQGVMCVYAVTSRSSFEELDVFRQQALRVRKQDSMPMVIVGNKCDLDSEREVLQSEGQAYADRYGLPFFEASAKENINVEAAFFSLVRQIRKTAPTTTMTTTTRICLLL